MERVKIFTILTALTLLASPSIAARQALNENASPSAKGGLNSNFQKANANFVETYATLDLKETKAVVQASAPADTTVDWYDTDQESGVLILKRHNGTTWLRASSHGVQYASSCASITAGMCVDTDDGKLYYHNGTAVVEVGSGGSVDLSAYLSKTNTTAFTPTADYHPATMKFVLDSIIAGGGYTDEQAQDSVCLMLSGNTETGITVTCDDATGKINFVSPTTLASFTEDATHRTVSDTEKFTWNAKQNAVSTTPLTASMVTGVFTGTGDCLGANGEKVACGGSGGYTNLTEFVGQTAWSVFYSNGSGDVTELVLGAPGTVLKSNGASAAPTWEADNTAAGAGYVSTPPTYSDEACTSGQYASSTSPLRVYSCLGNKWVYTDSTGLVDWSNPAPVTRTLTATQPSHGTITISDADLSQSIDCGSTCSATTADGATVSGITATPDSGYTFSAWTGDLSGTTNPTSIIMSANRSIGATFTASATEHTVYITDNTTDFNGVTYSSATKYTGTEDAGLQENGGRNIYNFGGSTSIELHHYDAGDQRNYLLRFTGLSNIPSGATVTAVELGFYRSGGLGADTLTPRRALRAWIEGTLTGTGWAEDDTPDSVCWNYYGNSTAWTTAGGLGQGTDISATSSGSISVANANGWLTSTNSQLVTDVQNFVNGTWTNNGWNVIATGTGVYSVIQTSEGANGQRPYLKVVYTY